jgi:hypothetical protein
MAIRILRLGTPRTPDEGKLASRRPARLAERARRDNRRLTPSLLPA